MNRYRTRPVEVEAIRWLGEENCDEVFAFLGEDHCPAELDHSLIYVIGISATWEAHPGYWIVRLPNGDQQALAPEVFAARYEPIPETGPDKEQP